MKQTSCMSFWFSVKDNGVPILLGNYKIAQTFGVCLSYYHVHESLSAPFLHPERSVCLLEWSRPLRKANSMPPPASTLKDSTLEQIHFRTTTPLEVEHWGPAPSSVFMRHLTNCHSGPRSCLGHWVLRTVGCCTQAHTPLLCSSWPVCFMNYSQSHNERAFLMGRVISTLF